MQQPHPTYYPCYQDGSGSLIAPEYNPKTYNVQNPCWENNPGYNVTSSNNYGPGPGQVPGGGGQTRSGVGPQQPTQPSQPTPTNTPPGGMHGDMVKQSAPAPQMVYGQRGPMTQVSYSRNAMPQQSQQIRPPNRHVAYNIAQIIPTAGQPVVHPMYPHLQQSHVMYNTQGRQNTHYPNHQVFMQQQQQLYNTPNPVYFQPALIQQYPSMQTGGPSPQATPPQVSVNLIRPTAMAPSQQPPPPAKTEQKKRLYAIKIIDPNTNEEVDTSSLNNNNNITPTRSNESSARETPQPDAGGSVPLMDSNAVAAEFAAKVAARVCNDEPLDHSPGPEIVSSIDSISDSETLHKQPPVVPSSDIVLSTLNTASEEFIPRSLVMQVPPPPHSEITVEPPQPYEVVPTVSAETDSPPVDIQRPPVVMKHTPIPAPVTQSPPRTTKKQKSGEDERQAVAVPVPVQPQLEVRDKHQPEVRDKPQLDVRDKPQSEVREKPQSDTRDNNKKGFKPVLQRDEPDQMPKERREKPRSVTVEQSLPATEVVPNVPVTLMTTQPPSAVKEVVEDSSPNKPQHQNGGTADHEPAPTPLPVSIPVPIDSNKTSKRQSGKKSGNKMRDLNRKGTEKEGSEMDAFTTEPTIMSEEKEKTPTPMNSPPPTPPPEIAEPEDNKIQEDIEEKEDKLVAAKNEENTKVSSLNRPEPEPAQEERQMPQLTLRHSYSKDQWSPLNPEGKRKYDRDFLFNLRDGSLSKKRPDNLPDVIAGMMRDISNMNMNFMNKDIGMIRPGFMSQSQSQRGGGMPLPKKGSQQGSRKGTRGVITISMSLNEDVKLKTSENAWKPNRYEFDTSKSEYEKETEELLKNVRGILNKLTPQKFDKLMDKFRILPINSEDRLTKVIDLIFDKAVDEPSFSNAYAKMCKLCSKMEVVKTVNGVEEKVNFRKLLITRCQVEFEKNKAAELNTEKWHDEIAACSDPEKRKEMQLAYEEKERMIRMKSVGNIRFIGELFKLGMLTPHIMYRCIEHLLGNPAEESLECLCKLLTTIGKELELASLSIKSQQPGPQPSLNPYFQKMTDLARNRGNSSKVSSRVRFMLQDVIDLRQSKWVPRREDNNPKTIEQINKEVEKETMENAALNQAMPRMNRQNDRPDDRKSRNRNQNDADGWNTVTGNRFNKFNPPSAAFESSKIQNIKNEDLNSLSLGGSQMYRFQTGSKGMETKPNNFASSNTFSALSSSKADERKPPQPMMNNRKMTPSPSIEREKERQRMMQIPKEHDGRSSRESSTQRERPQTPLRDSSVPSQSPAQTRREEGSRQLSEAELQKAREKIERQSQTMIEEYLRGDTTAEDVYSEVQQYTAENCGDFVQKALDMSIEKKAPAQKQIGLLISRLLDSELFPPELIARQFCTIYEFAEDFAVDIPKFWDLQAEIIVPILAAEKINFSHFKYACDPVLKTKCATALLLPVLSLLAREKGEGFVRNLWDSSSVNLKHFLPEEVNVDAFVEEKSIKYLTGEAPKCEAPSMDQVQERILKLIQNNQPYEKILDFISTNVGDRVEDVSFIRALVAAFCEACIGPNYVLNSTKFKKYEKLIERFVDHIEDRELACLSAVHILCCKLEHPQGLILSIFKQFSDDNLISNESFVKWKDDKHVTLETKGVSLFALTSFFATLEEVETDDENS